MKNYPLKIAVLLLVLLAASCKPVPEIVSVTDDKGTTDAKGPEVTGSVNVKVNIEAIVQEKTTGFTIPLPDEKRLTLIRKRLDDHKQGRFAWYGIIEKDPGSFVLLSITPRAISGKISSSTGETYTISYIGNGIHRIDQIDESKLPERNNDDKEVAPPADDQQGSKEKDCPDPATQVDVMILYTADAAAGAGGAEGMEAFIYECIYFTNLSYQNSNVNLTMHLVHFEEVAYAETGDEDIDLDALQGTADGVLDNIHALRDTHGADLVSMITETMGGCGLAFRQFPVTAGFESSAFSVVKRTCAAAGLSFAHETSHNMGARHDCANAANGATINHGHMVSNPADGGSSWRTVLAYNNCTDPPCTRIPFFSNPLLNFSPTGSLTDVDPMGTVAAAGVCTNDNTTVLNNAAGIVSNFRCSSPGIANVWMRDTWNDTGLEPDPATAAQAMWQSPYIWVRNSAQDPTFQHQHEHENPVVGIDNWIYVKLHNGGVADNGNLEIYYASASVSLTWPGAWTLLTTVPVNINAASTKIVEIPWTGLPGEGHYCMVARWSSTADPVGAETADIGANTRQNNNIVWRNLNIVGMDPDSDESLVNFFVQPGKEKAIRLEVIDEARFPKHAFVETGKVYLKLDEALFAAWKKGGSKGTGIKAGDGEIEIISANAILENLVMAGNGEKLKGSLRFVKSNTTIADTYHIQVKQTDGSGRSVHGGVSYELHVLR